MAVNPVTIATKPAADEPTSTSTGGCGCGGCGCGSQAGADRA